MAETIETALTAACLAAARQLREAGIETPELDARLLVCHAAGLTHEGLIARDRETPTPEVAARLEAYVARRLQGEPVSRIRGAREFYGRDFLIDRHTLDPRPDTETLIEAALEVVARRGWRTRRIKLLDLGTGTGCILLTLLAELPQANGVGTDMSDGALAVAADNARRLGLEGRARFIAADWLDGVAGSFDLILSNPPYIPSGEIAGLAPEVSAFDPRGALDGGPDGLAAYRRIATRAQELLSPDGVLIVEIGANQAEAVTQLLHAAGLQTSDGAAHDLAGRPRCVLAGLPPGRRRTSQGPKNALGKARCSG
ncbi:MAG: peptide chain release factor N(5)-glutamine methyltransferase [Methyloceanibacter sp.]|uniref:peptide chain release factor N(5)-glutamine methyltransferase n=1 Tax=Methyloceanibacter sp. TaxID=1965321 RepID=UPI003D6D8608